MTTPTYNMRELMEAGVHFGHKTKRWNPKMAPFLFGIRNDIHIIDLQQTVPMLDRALKSVQEAVARNGRVLFVGTKRQAQDVVAEYAKRCGQYYVNHRWLGGMLTNWKTISNSIKRLKTLEARLTEGEGGVTKKERLQMEAEREKLERALGGIREMGGLPDLIFVIDTNKESIAVKEAIKLGIPVIAVLDSNSDPDGITFPVPGNDDSTRAIRMYCRLISDAVLAGIEQGIMRSGKDVGASANLPESMTNAANGLAAAKADSEQLELLAEMKGGKKAKGQADSGDDETTAKAAAS